MVRVLRACVTRNEGSYAGKKGRRWAVGATNVLNFNQELPMPFQIFQKSKGQTSSISAAAERPLNSKGQQDVLVPQLPTPLGPGFLDAVLERHDTAKVAYGRYWIDDEEAKKYVKSGVNMTDRELQDMILDVVEIRPEYGEDSTSMLQVEAEWIKRLAQQNPVESRSSRQAESGSSSSSGSGSSSHVDSQRQFPRILTTSNNIQPKYLDNLARRDATGLLYWQKKYGARKITEDQFIAGLKYMGLAKEDNAKFTRYCNVYLQGQKGSPNAGQVRQLNAYLKILLDTRAEISSSSSSARAGLEAPAWPKGWNDSHKVMAYSARLNLDEADKLAAEFEKNPQNMTPAMVKEYAKHVLGAMGLLEGLNEVLPKVARVEPGIEGKLMPVKDDMGQFVYTSILEQNGKGAKLRERAEKALATADKMSNSTSSEELDAVRQEAKDVASSLGVILKKSVSDELLRSDHSTW